jgi:hypothetical protein
MIRPFSFACLVVALVSCGNRKTLLTNRWLSIGFTIESSYFSADAYSDHNPNRIFKNVLFSDTFTEGGFCFDADRKHLSFLVRKKAFPAEIQRDTYCIERLNASTRKIFAIEALKAEVL